MIPVIKTVPAEESGDGVMVTTISDFGPLCFFLPLRPQNIQVVCMASSLSATLVQSVALEVLSFIPCESQ